PNTDYTKDVRRLGQLRADKVCPTRWESPRSKDFPKWGGLYAEVASRRTQIKLVNQKNKQSVIVGLLVFCF
ncbi:hypothetical protein, partial [Enterococcus cecorum]|uniref:hypothetical protein n=1 Tax=Enterococcus cecorum TaxID=44008 RepID=UPI00196683A2